MPIDMSFGIVGIVPLILAYRHICVLEASSSPGSAGGPTMTSATSGPPGGGMEG